MKAVALLTFAMVIAGLNTPLRAFAADAERHAEVAQRGAEVMPFNLKATTHIFTKSHNGGSQRVLAKDPSDEVQTRLIRTHLREIQVEFRRGDFSARPGFTVQTCRVYRSSEQQNPVRCRLPTEMWSMEVNLPIVVVTPN